MQVKTTIHGIRTPAMATWVILAKEIWYNTGLSEHSTSILKEVSNLQLIPCLSGHTTMVQSTSSDFVIFGCVEWSKNCEAPLMTRGKRSTVPPGPLFDGRFVPTPGSGTYGETTHIAYDTPLHMSHC